MDKLNSKETMGLKSQILKDMKFALRAVPDPVEMAIIP